MTPVQLDEMVEARLGDERRQRIQRANEICALIYGQRHKRPNLQRLHRELVGDREDLDLEDFAEMLEESNARVPPAVRAEQLRLRQQALDEIEGMNRDN